MSLYHHDHLTFGIYQCESNNGQMIETNKVGDAVLLDNNRYYSLRLDSIPSKTLYLTRNNKKSGEYLIFEKRLTPFRFDRLVGHGKLRLHLKEHLEIKLPKYKLKIYMSLFPENINYPNKEA